MRSIALSLLSLVITAITIFNAYYQKKQFYPTVVYITKSNPSMTVSPIIYSLLSYFHLINNYFLLGNLFPILSFSVNVRKVNPESKLLRFCEKI